MLSSRALEEIRAADVALQKAVDVLSDPARLGLSSRPLTDASVRAAHESMRAALRKLRDVQRAYAHLPASPIVGRRLRLSTGECQ